MKWDNCFFDLKGGVDKVVPPVPPVEIEGGTNEQRGETDEHEALGDLSHLSHLSHHKKTKVETALGRNDPCEAAGVRWWLSRLRDAENPERAAARSAGRRRS